jgi:hypothetical protein
MNSEEAVSIWNLQRPLYKLLETYKKRIGISPASVHLLQVMNVRRGSSRVFNPSSVCADCYGTTFRWRQFKWLRLNGYITKLGKFEYCFENKAIEFLEAFNSELEAKIRLQK